MIPHISSQGVWRVLNALWKEAQPIRAHDLRDHGYGAKLSNRRVQRVLSMGSK